MENTKNDRSDVSIKDWVVIGNIVGKNLPKSTIKIGNFNVGPLPKGLSVIKRPECKSFNYPGNSFFYGRPGVIDITSECFFWIDCKRCTADEAVDRVEKHDLPLLQAAFTMNFGGYYHAQVQGLTDGKTNISAHSNSMSFMFFDSNDFDSKSKDLLISLYKKCDDGNIAKKSAQLISMAMNQQHTAGENIADKSSAILFYYKSIEGIVSSIPIEFNHELDYAREDIIKKLFRVLKSNKNNHKKINAIRDANSKVIKSEFKTILHKIEKVGKLLELSDSWIKHSQDLARLRNQKISHSGCILGKQEANFWLSNNSGYNAKDLSLTLLKKYSLYHID